MGSLNISTMTAITKMPCHIDLQSLYNNIRITNDIKYVELSKDMCKGSSSKKQKKKRKDKKQKVFFNQLTFNVFHRKIINIKVFNNGKIQMTGLKRLEWGKEAVNKLIDSIFESESLNTSKALIDNQTPYSEFKEYVLSNYSIVLINSNFELPHKINRDSLHYHLIEEDVFSSYEACNYPGVNIKYYYNQANPLNNGVCPCECQCSGKGLGKGFGDCKRVTIAAFYSGSIIITGARDFKQLFCARDFIQSFIKTHESSIAIK